MKNDATKIFGTLKLFEGVIGQDNAKKLIKFYLSSFYETGRLPNFMLNAPIGTGKTTIAKEFAKGVTTFDDKGKIEWVTRPSDGLLLPKRRKLVTVNAATVRNTKAFVNSKLIPEINGKDVVVFIDEAGDLPHDLSMNMLDWTNPTPDGVNVWTSEDGVEFTFDIRHVSFILATSEPQQVNKALMNRLIRIDLESYNYSQLGEIIKRSCKDVTFKDDVLTEVATILRGNARQAEKMAENIRTYLASKTVFGRKDWDGLKAVFNILPLGLNPTELQIMQFLSKRGQGTSLTQLSAFTGASTESIRRDYEIFLLSHQLIEITTTGRQLTGKGKKYLDELENPNRKQVFSTTLVVQ
jgi:Holliday junction resolvasome RuvABC ATP-dependent DNA helicase subunit